MRKILMAAAAILGMSVSAQAGTDPYLGEVDVLPYSFCPQGFLPADGRLLAIADNDALFALYGDALSAALDESSSLVDAIAQYLEVSREYRGVVRASAEILQARSDHAAARRRLREVCAGVLAWHLREPLTQREARIVARVLVDVLDQYTHMEAAEWLKPRRPQDVAEALSGMVTRGVYAA